LCKGLRRPQSVLSFCLMRNPPIVVVVLQDRYEVYSMQANLTWRDMALNHILDTLMDIDEVVPGEYYFNVSELESKEIELKLVPKEKEIA